MQVEVTILPVHKQTEHRSHSPIAKIMLSKVSRRERVEISASSLSRTVEALESWREAIGNMGTRDEIGSLLFAEERGIDC